MARKQTTFVVMDCFQLEVTVQLGTESSLQAIAVESEQALNTIPTTIPLQCKRVVTATVQCNAQGHRRFRAAVKYVLLLLSVVCYVAGLWHSSSIYSSLHPKLQC